MQFQSLVRLAVPLAFAGLAAAQTPGPRLPLDPSPEPRQAPSNVPLQLDRDRQPEEAPPNAAQLRLRLNAITLEGNRALVTETLEPLWRDRLGQEVTLADVFEIASRITARYRTDGYVLSQALVPRQEISQADARVRIRIVEGYISRVDVSPTAPGRDRIVAMLEPVLAERPLRLATLERQLLLVNDLPGVDARAVLRAAQEADAAAMELMVEQDRDAYSLALHNRTSAAVGPNRLEASAERRGLLGAFDRHVLRWAGSGSSRLNLIAYEGQAPIGIHGLTAHWALSASRSKPRTGELFQFDTDANNASVGLSYPLLRSRAANVTPRISLAGYDGESDIAGGLTVTEERIRTLRLGVGADLADRFGGVNLLDIEAVRGLSGLGASRAGDPALPRLGVEPQFDKFTLYAARLQSLGGDWSLLVAASAQHSGDLLPSSEQFGLGGDVFLRAYDPSELLGDKGVAGKIELRWNVALGPVAAMLYAFHDAGSVRVLDGLGGSTRQSALSTGIGARFSGPRGLKGYVEIAKPRHKATARDGDERTRVFAGIGIDL